MSAADRLREDAAACDLQIKSLTERIEDAEKKIVDLRWQRDRAVLDRVEALYAADFLDKAGFVVERNDAGIVTLRLDPPSDAA